VVFLSVVKKHQPIKKVPLDAAFYKLQKTGVAQDNFGLDNSSELLGGGFGLYSTANMAPGIGPVKTEFYRMALTRQGSLQVKLGLEAFHPQRNTIVFGFPGQVFTLWNKSPDVYAYYILFKEDFVMQSPVLKNIREFPFMSYMGVQGFELSEEEGLEIEELIQKINSEIKRKDINTIASIELCQNRKLPQAGMHYSNGSSNWWGSIF
jgi:hypothetical protein